MLKGRGPLIEGAKKGNVERVRTEIARGEDLNKQNKKGQTALMLAIVFAKIEAAKHITKMLIRAGVDLDKQDRFGETALMYASRKGRFYIVEMLLSAGAKIDLKSFDGHTALSVATNIRMVDLLIKRGANIENTIFDGRTIFMNAAYENRVSIMKKLRNAGANTEAVDSEGWNALAYTIAWEGCAESCEYLLKIGADINPLLSGHYPLDKAYEKERIVKYIEEHLHQLSHESLKNFKKFRLKELLHV